jgi:hypothetical protein
VKKVIRQSRRRDVARNMSKTGGHKVCDEKSTEQETVTGRVRVVSKRESGLHTAQLSFAFCRH